MSNRRLYFLAITFSLMMVFALSSTRAEATGDTLHNAAYTETGNILNNMQSQTWVTAPQEGPFPLSPPGILDDFNRANGPVGANWSGDTAGYAIVANQLDVGSSEDIYWNVTSFGVDQEVFVTLATIDPNADEIGLILKAQDTTGNNTPMISVIYNPPGEYVQVWTYDSQQGWQQRGSNISATFVNGDQFGALAQVNGDVTVYKNGVSIGTRSASPWPAHDEPGYIGLFNINASNTVLDDFGGGTADIPPPPPPCTDPLTCDPVSGILSRWRCNLPGCVSGDWLGAVIAWPWWAAYESNNRAGENSRTVFTLDESQVLNPYMKEWANGCQITAVSGTTLIIEWERGAETWRETYLNPGDTYTINLTSPENGVLIEGPDGVLEEFRVSLSNCTPPPPPLTMGEPRMMAGTRSSIGDLLHVQQVTLPNSGIAKSMSIYVNNPSAGQLRLGIYADDAGAPGALLAETAAFTPILGWNTQNLVTEPTLHTGAYWLAFVPSNNGMQFAFTPATEGHEFTAHSFAPLPNPFTASTTNQAGTFSVYATLIQSPTAVSLSALTAQQTPNPSLPFQITLLLSALVTMVLILVKKHR